MKLYEPIRSPLCEPGMTETQWAKKVHIQLNARVDCYMFDGRAPRVSASLMAAAFQDPCFLAPGDEHILCTELGSFCVPGLIGK
jgi:hypothetical protein